MDITDVRRARKNVIQKVRRYYKTQGMNIQVSTKDFPTVSRKSTQEEIESLYDYYTQMLGREVSGERVAQGYQGRAYSLETGEIYDVVNIAPMQADYIDRLVNRVRGLGNEVFTQAVTEQLDYYAGIVGRDELDEIIQTHQDIADDLYDDLHYAESYTYGRPYATNYAFERAMTQFSNTISRYIAES